MDDHSQGTRANIVQAFNRLVLSTRRARPPIAQLLREAGVARSTLYAHFDDRDTLLLEAMRGPLSVIVAALRDPARIGSLSALLVHFWDQRREASELVTGRFSVRLVRALAEALATTEPELEPDDVLRIADTQIGMIRLWITGETPGPAPNLAAKMIAAAAAQRAAFAKA